MTRKQRRGILIGLGVAILSLAAILMMVAFRQSIVFFHTPSDIAEAPVAPGTRVRLGGLVAEGSVKRGEGTHVEFSVTDTLKTVAVVYDGVLPDLFREGQGVVTEGTLSARRRLRCRHGSRQARRNLYAARGGQGAPGEGREARQRRHAQGRRPSAMTRAIRRRLGRASAMTQHLRTSNHVGSALSLTQPTRVDDASAVQ